MTTHPYHEERYPLAKILHQSRVCMKRIRWKDLRRNVWENPLCLKVLRNKLYPNFNKTLNACNHQNKFHASEQFLYNCNSTMACCFDLPSVPADPHEVLTIASSLRQSCMAFAFTFTACESYSFGTNLCHRCTPFVISHFRRASAREWRLHQPIVSLADDVSYPNDPMTENRYNQYHQQHRTNIALAKRTVTEQKIRNYGRFVAAILEMSRLQNYLPSMVLVFLGSWMAAGRTMDVFLTKSVWITAICSALITVASMLANDIFDYRSGNDRFNEKSTPLLKGQIHADDVELVAGCLYGAAVIGLCYLEPVNLRLLIGGAAVSTYIYTPFFKKLTVVKNVVVSGIISSSILAGAMVIGGKERLPNSIIGVSLFFFLCILGREILMDVQDMVGDKAAGVKTLAVRFGGRIGTIAASVCLAAANALLISFLAVRAKAYATAGTLSLLPLHAKVLQLICVGSMSGRVAADTVNSIKQIVAQSMIHIGLGVLLLATAP